MWPTTGSSLPYPIDMDQIAVSSLGLLPVQKPGLFQYTFDGGNSSMLIRITTRCRFRSASVSRTGSASIPTTVWSKMLSSYDSSGWGSRNGTNAVPVRPEQFLRAFQLRHPAQLEGFGRLCPAVRQGQAIRQPRKLEHLVGGWQVSSLFIYQSGNTFTAQMNSNNTIRKPTPSSPMWCLAFPCILTTRRQPNRCETRPPSSRQASTNSATKEETSCVDRSIPMWTSRPPRP